MKTINNTNKVQRFEGKISKNTLIRFFTVVMTVCFAVTLLAIPAFATETGDAGGTSTGGSLAGSSIVTGITKLVNDLSTVLMVLCPTVGGAAAVYFTIRRSMADEQDGKMWSKRITTAIICGVAGLLVSGLITLLSGYFS